MKKSPLKRTGFKRKAKKAKTQKAKVNTLKPKSKKMTISRLREKVWTVFSKYTRLKDAVGGYVKCITCGKLLQAVGKAECEAGHYEHGKNKEHYFNEDNVHPQCTRCNRYLSGNLRHYTLFMLDEYGQDTINRLMNSKKVIWKREELERIYKEYTEKLNSLEAN